MDSICPVCGSSGGSVITPKTWDATYVRCSNCKHEREVQADRLEQDEPYFDDDDYFYFSPFSEWLSSRAAKQRVRALSAHLHGGSVLEVGPGSGNVISAAESAGFSVSAAEGSEAFVRHLRSSTSAKVFHGLFEDIEFGDEVYDALLSFHVIEHVPDPEAHLLKMREIVKPGGLLLLATPNSSSWDRRLFGDRWTGYSIGHLNLFSSESMNRTLEEAGWEVVRVSTVEFSWQLLWTLKAAIKPKKNAPETAGSNVKGMPVSMGAAIVKIFGVLTSPFRCIQERMGGGNELFIVARNRGTAADKGDLD